MTQPREGREEHAAPQVARPAAGGLAAPLQVQLLGGFAIWQGDRAVDMATWRLQKARTLVKLVALAPGHRLNREQLADLLWPDLEPEAAANNLHYALFVARRALVTLSGGRAPSALRLHAGILSLEAEEGLAVDVDAFEAAAARARRSRSTRDYHAALALYTGDLLPDDRYEDWVVGRREALRETFLALLGEVAALHQAQEEHEEAIAALERLVASEPAHEAAQAALMRLYARTGRRHQALRQYAQLEAALRSDLDAEPAPATVRLHEEIVAGRVAPPAAPSAPARRDNLPAPLTSFVGRHGELAALRALLQQDTGSVASGAARRGRGQRRVPSRLLTLIGPGGAGKTRLALALADEVHDPGGPFPDGAWFVDLAALDDAAQVPTAVAAALGLPDDAAPSLASTLAHKRLLLILDNCEHLLEGCATLAADLLAACPGMRILATSREPLGLPGEQPWAVPPLSAPAVEAPLPPAAALQYDAVRLFMERAQVARPHLALDETTVGAVLRICRAVAGLPLALELAAGRAGALSLEEMATDLQASLRLLASGPRATAGRQRSMRATLEWSYRLLSTPEQALLRRLAVFAGGCTRLAAEAVCAGDELTAGAVLEVLAGLVHRSLVVVEGLAEGEGDGGAAPRYRLLEPVRHYAAERLSAAGEADCTHDLHLRHYTALAESGEVALRGAEQAVWLARLEQEHDNMGAALRWALESGQVTAGVRLAGALGRFWTMRGHLSAGRRWLEDLLARPGGPAGEPEAEAAPYRARALRMAGLLASEQGDYARAVEYYNDALAALAALGDTRSQAIVLNNLGNVAGWQGDESRALAYYEESLALLRAVGEPALLSAVLGNLGGLAVEGGDAERAAGWLAEALALQRQLGDQDAVAKSLTNLAEVAHLRGDDQQAAALLEESLAVKRALGTRASIAVSLASLAGVVAQLGDTRRAAELYRESLTLREELGDMHGLAQVLEGVAMLARRLGQAEQATRLHGAADALRATLDAARTPVQRARHQQEVAALRTSLGAGPFEREWTAGRALPLEAALAAARAVDPH